MEFHEFHSGGLNLSYSRTGSGEPLHFAHANGFSSGVYSKLISQLSSHHTVFGLNHCTRFRCEHGCNTRPEKVQSWDQFAAELIGFLDAMGMKPYIGVGHSLGGVSTMIASVKRPDLFSRIIMLDPVLLPSTIINLMRILRLTGQGGKFPLAIRARKRRDEWQTIDEIHQSLRHKTLFKDWEDEVFEDYVKYGFVEIEGRWRLACPPETEAQIFESYYDSVWKTVKQISVPVTLIRGEHSDTLFEGPWRRFAKLRPEADMRIMPGAGHLFPMEKPRETVEQILTNSSRTN